MRVPIVKTSTKAIAVVADEGSKSYDRTIKEMEEMMGRIVEGSEAKAMVLIVVLKEMLSMGRGCGVFFDFGGKKEWKLKRVK